MGSISAATSKLRARRGAQVRAAVLLLAALPLLAACSSPHRRSGSGHRYPGASDPGFMSPVDAGTVSSRYGSRRVGAHRGYHRGIDITTGGAPAPVFAAQDGRVTAAARNGSYGRWIEIAHGNGWVTRYAHLSQVHVRRGQRVSRGAPIGTTGSSGNATGVHLHFEVLRHGRSVDPLTVLPSLTSRSGTPETRDGAGAPPSLLATAPGRSVHA